MSKINIISNLKNIDNLIENFDKALSHPNQVDLEKLENIIQNNYSKN